MQRGTDLLARIVARPNGANNGNLPWVLNGLLGALIDSGHLHEAHALVPRTFATDRRFGTLASLPLMPKLAHAQQRLSAAARLSGYTRRRFMAAGARLDAGETGMVDAAIAAAAAAFGREHADRLVQLGHALEDDAALALALGSEP